MSGKPSVIILAPASAAFVDARTTSLGPWVLGAFLDCILMGVIFCQTLTFFRTRGTSNTTLQQYYRGLVLAVVFLSILKTAQCIAVVWVQNVLDYANPDVARTLVAKAWWQVSLPLMTGIIGATVQSFFCLRFFMLSRNWMLCVPIICAMCLGLAGVCLSLANILAGNAKAKVMISNYYFSSKIHLVGVFIADFLITAGTIYSLQKRNSGLERTTQLINRLLRLVFESAFPPTILATTDLIMTQTLGSKLLWHLFINMALGKAYVVSLLYTLNSINEYRVRDAGSQEVYSYNGNGRGSRRNNLELAPRGQSKTDQIFVQTQIDTHVSPSYSPTHGQQHELQIKDDFISKEFRGDDSSSERAGYAQ
ncbi:hypothetical protein DFH07DRAFT_955212 [Mycena maculata]|uniref:DUF6534 domain-containing protein n=1 Tax=Mycena maculata TaxID=230809 RepID=A0AAD7JJZ9_9AGAR|nr:hypothetical protein DFH07DRAFT_955212 [Mycena maculata]